jgi:GNAT superfamily N-acetyltransferase
MSVGAAAFDLLAIEQAAVRGWPALQSALVDGWVWRCSSGGSVRANTVAALAYTGAGVDAAIDDIERRYRAAGAPPRFTISPVSVPGDLDARLAARGYRRGEDHVTMAKPVAAPLPPLDAIEIGPEPTPEWMEVYLSGLSADRRPVAGRILPGLPQPRMYFAARRGGRLVGSGLSIADGALASVQCMATLPEAQRQGCARAVLGAIEAWAASQGCRTLYLQTGGDNRAALALYQSCGFSLARRYHTRELVA